MDHHHFGYNTKLGKKKEEKKTLLHTSLFYTLCTTDRVKNLQNSKRKTA
jgi:catechol-2,3-dioxygenase